MLTPARPPGRPRHEARRPSPVKAFALEHGIAGAQPRGLRLDGRFADDADARARGAASRRAPDVLVVAAYGLILPPWLLALPRLGCLNIHASLLPRWRGAAPIQRAIEAGDARPASPSCRWTRASTPAPMLLAEPIADRRRRQRGDAARRAWPRSAAR